MDSEGSDNISNDRLSDSLPRTQQARYVIDGQSYSRSQFFEIRRKKRMKEETDSIAEFKRRMINVYDECSSRLFDSLRQETNDHNACDSVLQSIEGGSELPTSTCPQQSAQFHLSVTGIVEDQQPSSFHSTLNKRSEVTPPPLFPLPDFPNPRGQNENEIEETDEDYDSNAGGDIGDLNKTSSCISDDECSNEANEVTTKRKQESDSEILLRQKKNELHGIFCVHGVTHAGQATILKFFQEFPAELLSKLPRDARSLRPPQIEHSRRVVPPGEVVYFGIERMLNYAVPGTLFDENSNEVNLCVNMDGLPLTRSANGIGFWPILGCISEYAVFVIGAYAGREKPECPNNYIYDFVHEVKKLCARGVCVRSRTYKFRLKFMNMDGPATSMITGVKHPGGYYACRRCKVKGKIVTQTYVSKNGRQISKRLTVRYPTLHAAKRTHRDFLIFARTIEEPHVQNRTYVRDADVVDSEMAKAAASILSCHMTHGNCDYEGENEEDAFYLGDNNPNLDDPLNDELIDDYDDVDDDEGTGEVTPIYLARLGRKHLTAKDAKSSYHLHRTLLTEIPYFDIALDCVLDFMHMVGGHVRTLLNYFTGKGSYGAMYKLDDEYLRVINERLIETRKFCPREFQRKPESLQHLSSWKATQIMQFLLYVGPVVLRDAIDASKLHHFNHLVAAMRLMCRKLPELAETRDSVVKQVAEESRNILQKYFEIGNELYGENFSLYLAHAIPHIPDDYERFKMALFALSAFKYENCLGHIKRMITGHCQPLTQLINKISSLLHTKLYTKHEKSRVVHSLEAYYEQPQLCKPVEEDPEDRNNDNNHDNYDDTDSNAGAGGPEAQEHSCLSEFERAQTDVADPLQFEHFREIRYRDFILRTDNQADKYCFMISVDGTEDFYVRLSDIFRDRNTGEIFLVGNVFRVRSQPLFTLAPTSLLSSTNCGISICDQLSERMYTFPLKWLSEKCFALPLYIQKGAPESTYKEWVIMRYLH